MKMKEEWRIKIKKEEMKVKRTVERTVEMKV